VSPSEIVRVGIVTVPVKVGAAMFAFAEDKPEMSVVSFDKWLNKETAFGDDAFAGEPPSPIPYKKYLSADCIFATSTNDGIAVLKFDPSAPIKSAMFFP
jgi:hypothetical protein